MCGRYTLRKSPREVADACDVDAPPELRARYNIAPTQRVLAARPRAGARPATGPANEAAWLRWGWTLQPSGTLLLNIRSEGAHEKRSFRTALLSRRCVLPADGFYEWRRGGDRPVPFHLRPRDGGLLLFAGLWTGDGDHGAAAILTTSPNAVLAPIHDRMPVILSAEGLRRWLAPDTPEEELRGLLRPCSEERLEAVPVGERVGSVKNDDESCLSPPEKRPEQLELF